MTFALLVVAASLFSQTVLPLPQRRAQTTRPEAHYRIYDASGKQVTIEDVLAAMDKMEVACVGEIHDDVVAHMFELDLLRGAAERGALESSSTSNKARRPVVLSLEMFERDVQTPLDEYLGGLISEKHFLSSSRPWDNYQQDYRPLIEYAREHQLAVVAANAPARYVNQVSRLGPDSLNKLSLLAKAWLPPLPYPQASAAYAAKFNQFMQSPATDPQAGVSPHATTHLLDAQTLRDAAMGQAIAEQLRRRPGALVVQVNGRFHSEEGLGVPEQLAHYRPKTRTLVITIVSGSGFPNFDKASLSRLGDFIVLTDSPVQRSF